MNFIERSAYWLKAGMTILVIAAFLLALTIPKLAQNVFGLAGGDFSHEKIGIHTGDAKMLADFTGDGKLDWAVGGFPSEPLEVYPYPYDSGTKYNVASASDEFTTDAEAGDIDGDGDVDMVVPDNNNGIRLFINGGNGQSWTEAGKVSNVGGITKDVELADFDGNGLMDVAARDSGGSATVYFQASALSWQGQGIGNVGGQEGMDSGDVDGDGDIDLIGQGKWFDNPGTASGGWSSNDIGSADGEFRAAVADFNADGKNDVVFSCAECGGAANIEVYIQGSGGGFSGHTAGTMAGAHTLEAGDYDGDGDIDLFAGAMIQAGAATAVFENGGDGTSWTRIDLGTTDTGIHIGRSGDIDGDGDIDLLGAHYTGNNGLHVWTNNTNIQGCVVDHVLDLGPNCDGGGGGGNPTPTVSATPCVPTSGGIASLDNWSASAKLGTDGTAAFYWRMLGTGSVAEADINGDGFADIASGENVWISPGEDAGSAGSWQSYGGFSNVAIIADIDQDGETDDVIDIQNGSWHTWSGSGFTQVANPSIGARGEQGYAVGDVVPGGNLEVVLATSSGGSDDDYTRTLIEYSGSSASASQVAGGASNEGVDLADINGDGLLDIVGNDGDNYGWWESANNGSSFTKHTVGTRDSGFFSDKTLAADLDKDGDVEIVGTAETSGSGGDIYVFTQNGGDINSAAGWDKTVAYTNGSANSLDLNDMDGDGYKDIISGEHRGSKLAIAKNPGDGSFTNWQEFVVSTEAISHHGGAQAGDFNGDGILDIASIEWTTDADTSELFVWINESTTGGGSSNDCPDTSPTPTPEPTETPDTYVVERCPITQDQGHGSITFENESSMTLGATETYRVWVRMLATDADSDSFILDTSTVDSDTSGCSITFGDAVDSADYGTWTWTSYDATSEEPVDIFLPSGSHIFTITGTEAGVGIDRVLVTSSLDCTPEGLTGENCEGTSTPTPTPDGTATPTPDATATPNGQTPTPTPNGQTPTPTPDGQTPTPTPTPTATPDGQTPTPSPTPDPEDTTGPNPASNFRVTGTTSTRVLLAWNASTSDDVALYRLFRDGSQIAETTGVEYVDEGLQENTKYTYQLLAVDASDNISSPVTLDIRTDPGDPGGDPADNVIVVTNPNDSANVSFNTGQPTTGVVEYGTNGRLTNSTLPNTGPSGDHDITIDPDSLEPDTQYSYRVKTTDEDGNVAYSPVGSFVTPKQDNTLRNALAAASILGFLVLATVILLVRRHNQHLRF